MKDLKAVPLVWRDHCILGTVPAGWRSVRAVSGAQGQNQVLQSMPPSGSFFEVSSGYRHSCALQYDGSVHCWGCNNEGQCDAPEGAFIHIACGHSHSCGIRKDGTIACWGSNEHGQSEPPYGRFSHISSGIKSVD